MGIKRKYADFPKWFKYFSTFLGIIIMVDILMPSSDFGLIIDVITFLMVVVYVIAGFCILMTKTH